ncbi:DUF3343 domain-containing protein [Escherichia coli]|uniref:DUF3343 domain-containing protein n=1 Tax=Escherichia coli TaxID=562 RepID=UPI0012604448|nr:DUF3343 domain-containing protein [Escherichia coli]
MCIHLNLMIFTKIIRGFIRALQAAGMTFRVSDIPRDLRGGCGLCIWLTCSPGEEIQWVIPGHTESVYCQQDGGWRCIAHYGISPR